MALDPEKEFEGLYRTHNLDKPKEIAWIKKTIKSKTVRINSYEICDLIDGKMLKLHMEKFVKKKDEKTGRMLPFSSGTRSMKAYLSVDKCEELVKLLDAIPRKSYQDMRTKEFRERPEKIIKERTKIEEIDLDKLFD